MQGGRGGDRIVDSFKVTNDEIVSKLVRGGDVSMRRGGLAVGLVGPLEFKWSSSRAEDHEPKLRVLGHVGTLQRVPGGSPAWGLPGFTDEQESWSTDHKVAMAAWAQAHKVAIAKGLRRLATIPKSLSDFITSPAGRLLA